jgi:hypothetical protein
MVNIKEMPHGEKYAKVTDNMKFDETFILPFVQKHLGDQAEEGGLGSGISNKVLI